MNVLVLGGCGIQGKGALYDLSRNPSMDRIICADLDPERIHSASYIQHDRIIPARLNAQDKTAMVSLMKQDVDVVIDLLPSQFVRSVAEAAIEAGVSVVNTNYGYDVLDLHETARRRGIAIMPECGLDPGIDLVIYGYGLRQFDELHTLNSYCGGIPEKKACTNPLNYKISWNWDMVLKTQKRSSSLIKDHRQIDIPAEDQHDNPFIHEIEFPGLGRLEAFPNGNAVRFSDLLGVRQTIRETGRYTLRWPGWCNFWSPLKKLGFLCDDPVPGLPCAITPHQFLTQMLEPRLQYQDDEKDLAVMQNVFTGIKNGKRKTLIFNVLIERDLNTGLMGMAIGVSYPACIVAEMIATGVIPGKGVLSPIRDIPSDPFLSQLQNRGIVIEKIVQE
ncbi:MAG: saccharopine dehydrogenase NADP-binding domain-containing protein [Deltaproteobacteria bacterium]|nr:saccharopine dehydrogenase NADP-binding domain-containing protein [Deltaproteobacteria bacterium]